MDPLRADSFLDLGYLLYVAGRYDESRAEVQKLLDLNPQASFGHFTIGLDSGRGRKAEAGAP